MPARVKSERQREHDRRRRAIHRERRYRHLLLIQLNGLHGPSLASRGGVESTTSASETVLVDNPTQLALPEVLFTFSSGPTHLHTGVDNIAAIYRPLAPVYLVELDLSTDESFEFDT